MRNLRLHVPFSMVSLVSGAVAVLSVAYIGLIAIVMSYAVLTVEFSQSIKNAESAVAILESNYLAGVSRINGMDYIAAGYTKPLSQTFVRAQSGTALR